MRQKVLLAEYWIRDDYTGHLRLYKVYGFITQPNTPKQVYREGKPNA